MAFHPPELLLPPYREISAFDRATPPPSGTIALVRQGEDAHAAETTIGFLAAEVPWVPVVLWTPPPAPGPPTDARAPVQIPPGSTVPIIPSHRNGPPPIFRLLAAVAARKPPSPTALGAWTASRMGCPDRGDLLAAAMCPVLRPKTPAGDRQLRRGLRQADLPPRLRLAWLGRLALADRFGKHVVALRAEMGVRPRQLARWLEEVVGCDTLRWREQPGWEWVVEEAARRCHHQPG